MNHTHFLLFVIFGLTYDNLIIAFGRFIGEGKVLECFSYVRFWLHALFTPTLIIFAWNIYFRTSLLWAKRKFLKALAYTITISLILYELFTSVKGLQLEPNWRNRVLTYESTGQSMIPITVIMITLIFGIIGLLFMMKFRYSWLFIGNLIMISGGILTTWIQNFPTMNVLEFLFITSLLLTKQYLVRTLKTNSQEKLEID
jgi:hypothetical protein